MGDIKQWLGRHYRRRYRYRRRHRRSGSSMYRMLGWGVLPFVRRRSSFRCGRRRSQCGVKVDGKNKK
ncbi:hypothetical protein [Absidia glauca]|uniref:Uncharacterized protein n=1 Tax=Absidia glauca TaxID=4829 RepID=A0A163KKT7_ABSGL|nr:hypothetical protein [Absidia glauca]